MIDINSRRTLVWIVAFTLILSSTTFSLGGGPPEPSNQLSEKVRAPAEARGTTEHSITITEKEIEGLMLAAQKAYTQRQTATYRMMIFALQNETRAFNASLLVRRTDLLTRVGRKSGFDGLETLALTYFDAFAKLDPIQGAKAKTALRGKVTYAGAPAAGLPVPLARAGSKFVLDVRADAVRALLGELVAGDDLDLAELLAGRNTRKRMCELPTARDEQGQVPPQEKEREKNCKAGGTAGRPGASSVSTALGSLAESACFGGAFTENLWMQQRLNDMEECENTRDAQTSGVGTKAPTFGPFALGAGCVASKVCVALVAAAVGAVVGYGVQIYLSSSQQQHEANMKLLEQAHQDAVTTRADVTKAQDELGGLEATLETEKNKLKTIEQDISDLDKKIQDASRDEATRLREAKRIKEAEKTKQQEKVNAAQTQVNAKKDEVQRKKEAQQAAEKKLKDAEGKVAKDFLEPNPFPGSACQRLAFGGINLNDPAIVRKMGEGWKTFYGRLRNKINPNPESPATEALGMHDYCGLDSHTMNNSGAGCKSPTMCAPGTFLDENCRCISAGSTKSLREDASCARTNCPPGQRPTVRGVMCACATPEEQVPIGPRPPLPVAVKAFFENVPALSQPVQVIDFQSFVQNVLFTRSTGRSPSRLP